MLKASILLQNVPPALLVRFLREHHSEWADYNIDAYSAASLKAGSCCFPGLKTTRFSGSQIIMPLAHTLENEVLNQIVFELPEEHPLSDTGPLQELLGHTPLQTTFTAPEGNGPLATNLSSMGKGEAWVNGQSIGRYWSAYLSPSTGCSDECDYRGEYNSNKCLKNFGQPAQEL